MDNLSLAIFTREGNGGKEREGRQDWTEHPSRASGWPNEDIPLWQSGEEHKVFFSLNTRAQNGIAIISNGDLVEVWAGKKKLLGADKEILTDNGVIILPGQAVNPGGRTEIYFNEIGQMVVLEIKAHGETVKEVKILCESNL